MDSVFFLTGKSSGSDVVTGLNDTSKLNATNTEPFFYSNMTSEQVRLIHGMKMKQIMDLEADPCEDFYSYACK